MNSARDWRKDTAPSEQLRALARGDRLHSCRIAFSPAPEGERSMGQLSRQTLLKIAIQRRDAAETAFAKEFSEANWLRLQAAVTDVHRISGLL